MFCVNSKDLSNNISIPKHSQTELIVILGNAN